jgi:hypothetical protein
LLESVYKGGDHDTLTKQDEELSLAGEITTSPVTFCGASGAESWMWHILYFILVVVLG